MLPDLYIIHFYLFIVLSFFLSSWLFRSTLWCRRRRQRRDYTHHTHNKPAGVGVVPVPLHYAGGGLFLIQDSSYPPLMKPRLYLTTWMLLDEFHFWRISFKFIRRRVEFRTFTFCLYSSRHFPAVACFTYLLSLLEEPPSRFLLSDFTTSYLFSLHFVRSKWLQVSWLLLIFMPWEPWLWPVISSTMFSSFERIPFLSTLWLTNDI